MTDQHYYQIIVTKDDLYLELTSDDQDYVVAQLYRWFKIFLSSKYIPAPPLPKSKVSSAKVLPKSSLANNPQEQMQAPPPGYYPYPPQQPAQYPAGQYPTAQYPAMIDPNTGHPVYPMYPYPYPPQQPYPQQGQQQAYPYPYPPQQPYPQQGPQPYPEHVSATMPEHEPQLELIQSEESFVVQDDESVDASTQELFDTVMETVSSPQSLIEEDHAFEAVMDSLMRDLDEGEASPYDRPKSTHNPTPVAYEEPLAESGRSIGDLSEATDLSEAMDDLWPSENAMGSDLTHLALDDELADLKHAGVATATAEPRSLTVESLSDLCGSAHLSGPEDWLVLAAYYLSRYEGVKKFSLKRINGQMVKSGLTTVTHGVLESALARNHLVMVPDMTGTAESSEYTLSESGENYVHALLA